MTSAESLRGFGVRSLSGRGLCQGRSGRGTAVRSGQLGTPAGITTDGGWDGGEGGWNQVGRNSIGPRAEDGWVTDPPLRETTREGVGVGAGLVGGVLGAAEEGASGGFADDHDSGAAGLADGWGGLAGEVGAVGRAVGDDEEAPAAALTAGGTVAAEGGVEAGHALAGAGHVEGAGAAARAFGCGRDAGCAKDLERRSALEDGREFGVDRGWVRGRWVGHRPGPTKRARAAGGGKTRGW